MANYNINLLKLSTSLSITVMQIWNTLHCGPVLGDNKKRELLITFLYQIRRLNVTLTRTL